MAVFILVHGGSHGGWCRNKIVPELESRGHRALAPDLPGMGDDHTPIGQVSLSGWGEFIARIARRAAAPVVLVGTAAAARSSARRRNECPRPCSASYT